MNGQVLDQLPIGEHGELAEVLTHTSPAFRQGLLDRLRRHRSDGYDAQDEAQAASAESVNEQGSEKAAEYGPGKVCRTPLEWIEWKLNDIKDLGEAVALVFAGQEGTLHSLEESQTTGLLGSGVQHMQEQLAKLMADLFEARKMLRGVVDSESATAAPADDQAV